MKRALAILGVVLMVVAMSQVASASTILSFTSDHCTGGCLPDGVTSAGYVTLTQVGSDVNVAVQLTITPLTYFLATGAGDNLYFKFNDAGVTSTSQRRNRPAAENRAEETP
jgi:hypothetical protein